MLEEMEAPEFTEWVALYHLEHEEAQAHDLASTAKNAGTNLRAKR